MEPTPLRATLVYGNAPELPVASQSRPRPPVLYRHDFLTSLPPHLILDSLLPYLDAPSLNRFSLLSCQTRSFYLDSFDPHVNTLWRLRCVKDFGERSLDLAASDVVRKDFEWLYRMLYNLDVGQYRFTAVEEPKGLSKRSARHELMQNGGTNRVRSSRLVECTVGQPTAADTGYAVALHLFGSHLLFIQGQKVCVASADDPFRPARVLTEHITSVVALAVGKEIAVTCGENGACRVWFGQLGRWPKQLLTLDAPEVLDVAVHGTTVVTYDNSNNVKVWDIAPELEAMKAGRAISEEAKVVTKEINLSEIIRRYLALMQQPVGTFAPDPTPDLDGPAVPSPHVPLDIATLAREVKIAVWGTTLVCGFENMHFIVIALGPDPSVGRKVENGEPRYTLKEMQWPLLYHLHDPSPLSSLSPAGATIPSTYFSTSYPTVLQLTSLHLITRSPRANELVVFSLKTGKLLYRLSESLVCLGSVGFLPSFEPPGEQSEGVDVITDFAFMPAQGILFCTIEDGLGSVFAHAYDFGAGPCRGKEKPWKFEKRSLEWVRSYEEKQYEYPWYWVAGRW